MVSSGGHVGGGGGAFARSYSGGGNFSVHPSGGGANFARYGGGHDFGNRASMRPSGNPRNYALRNLDRSGPGNGMKKGDHGRFAKNDHDNRFDNRRFAERDHDHDRFDHDHFRHRVFRNGVWIWAYGPDYYAGDDCYWLRRQALATGSPYWWSRYNSCVSYY